MFEEKKHTGNWGDITPQEQAYIDNHLSNYIDKYDRIPIAQIDIEASSYLNERYADDEVHKSVIRSYAADMHNGDTFPAVILTKQRNGGRYIIVSGNQRVRAAKSLEYTHVRALLLHSLPEADFLVANIRTNQTHGLRNKDGDLAIVATRLMGKPHRKSKAEVARLLNISSTRLGSMIAVHNIRALAKDRDIKVDNVSDSAILELNNLNKTVQAEYLAMLHRFPKLTVAKVRQHVQEIKEFASDAEQVDYIANTLPTRLRRGPCAKDSFDLLVGYISSALNKSGHMGKHRTPSLDEWNALSEDWAALTKNMATLLPDIKPRPQEAA